MKLNAQSVYHHFCQSGFWDEIKLVFWKRKISMFLCSQDLCQKFFSLQVIYQGLFYSYLLQSLSKHERDTKWYVVLQRDIWILLDLGPADRNILWQSHDGARPRYFFSFFKIKSLSIFLNIPSQSSVILLKILPIISNYQHSSLFVVGLRVELFITKEEIISFRPWARFQEVQASNSLD